MLRNDPRLKASIPIRSRFLESTQNSDASEVDPLNQENFSRSTNVYVGNLTVNTSQGDLDLLFWPFGEISSCRLMLYGDGSPKGYGFVEFILRKSAIDAIKHLNGRIFRGRKLTVKITKPPKDSTKRLPTIHTSSPHGRRVTYGMSDRNLYIGGLPDEITEEELRSLFAAYGEVEDVRRFVDRSTQRILGTACVRMACAEDAAAALQGMNKASIKGKIIYCKYALDKSKKLAFHKPPPDRRLREQYFNEKSYSRVPESQLGLDIPGGAVNQTIESIVQKAMQQVFSDPQIQKAVSGSRDQPDGVPFQNQATYRNLKTPYYPASKYIPKQQALHSLPGAHSATMALQQPLKPASVYNPTQIPTQPNILTDQVQLNIQEQLLSVHRKQGKSWKQEGVTPTMTSVTTAYTPGASTYNPAADAATYNPGRDSSTTLTKRFDPFSTS